MKRIKQDDLLPELSFYKQLNAEEFNYEEFKNNALIRLKLLRRIENNVKDISSIKSREEDINSFFCLKLLSAQSKWSSNWFVTQETQLFKLRASSNILEAKQFFIEKVWPFLNVKENIDHDTFYSLGHRNNIPFNDNIKVHFLKCSDILAKRQHRVRNGFFELDQDVLISYLTDTFRSVLEESMDDLYERIVVEMDERLLKLNREMFETPSTTTTGEVANVLSNQDLFPLCIKGIIAKLKKERHLKYSDRQTLALFFKDIGCPLNDCVDFFRSHFNVTPDVFNKEYLYNIRHNYGLEGKRANYHSFPCARLIGMSNDASCFGCPFVNNHAFVKLNSDIEDISIDAIKCCSLVGQRIMNKPFEKQHVTPAEYFNMLLKEKNAATTN